MSRTVRARSRVEVRSSGFQRAMPHSAMIPIAGAKVPIHQLRRTRTNTEGANLP
ncbi:Uncharacterised protein [Mycobacteroides abscessus subsp. abscessus]|nr:Uncharacterised protein [Mycobacteroides abscessus subsp. abscessus]